jgi:hypothetical protein
MLFLTPARLSALGCDLGTFLGWQRGGARQAALAPQRYCGGVLLCRGLRLGGFPDRFKENAVSKLDWIARAFHGCHGFTVGHA